MKASGREPSRPHSALPRGGSGVVRAPVGDPQRASAPMRRAGNLDQVPTTILLEQVTGRARVNDAVARVAAPAASPPLVAVESSAHHQLTTVRENPLLSPSAVVLAPTPTVNPAPSNAVSPGAAVGAAGKVVVFFSTHGGTGATTLACNGAAALARRKQSTCLIDLDLQLGDALTVLGLEPRCAMSRLAHEMDSFDWEMLEQMLPRHLSGLSVVSQVGNLEELGELTVGRMPQVLRYLQGHFACLIVDGVRDFGDHALATMDVADQVVLVVTQSASAVRGASRRLAIFRRLGYPASKLQIVVNRYRASHPITLLAFSEALGQPPAAVIPEDEETMGRAALGGKLIHEVDAKSALDGAVEGMIHGLFGLTAPPRPVTRRWWSRRSR